jgi:hypothetical protein
MTTATAQVEKWVLETKRRTLAVRNRSISLLTNAAQLPVAKGGRMRVDTGFLRASGQMSLNGMPSGPVRGDDAAKKFEYDNGQQITPVNLILVQASLGTDIFFGWTANYARYRESKDAFLRMAVQRWPEFVAQAVREAKSRSGMTNVN